jgi:tetraacyldisaccharide 4'-kinase
LNEHAFRNLVSGQTHGFSATLVRLALRSLSAIYGGAILVRNTMFNHGLRKIRKASVPVISVGNLTTGGTGKTPVVALMVDFLQQLGRRPGIVSRGYRSVNDEANDEKLVLARLCPDVPHEQNASRILAAQRITQAGSVDVIVMDDGFQHRQLHRDFSIVLIDATNPLGYGFLLPRGLLREPLSSLRRADLVLITRADMVTSDQLERIESQVLTTAPQLAHRVHCIEFKPTGLINASGQRLPLEHWHDQPVVLVSGIGNPEAFAESCRRCGMRIVGTRWFPDHHHYSGHDLSEVMTLAESCGHARVVTTLKDLVKLPTSADIWALEIAAVFQNDQESATVERFLSAVVKACS